MAKAQPKPFYYSQLGIRALNKLKHFLFSLLWTSHPSRKLPPSLQHQRCRFPLLPQPLPPPTPMFCRGHSLQMGATPLFNPTNSPLLQPSSSAAATADSVANIVSLSHTHQVISLKLTNTNYLYWRMQMKPYLLGQGVFGFVDGSNSCPSPHVLTVGGTSLQVNQFFLRWKQQDQLILSALVSSLSVEVLHLVVYCQTSSSVWRPLEQAPASISHSRIMQLHGSL